MHKDSNGAGIAINDGHQQRQSMAAIDDGS
jgi:hypothetical protein